MRKLDWLKLLSSIGFCQVAGAIGSIFTASAIPFWYASLAKPFFNPPAWVFAPAWITLYSLMGISLYLVWISKTKLKREAIKIFTLQLVFNSLWSIIFFGLRLPAIAFIEIIILWFLILATIIKFYKINKISAYLLIPYILWTSFASLLNFSIWVLNR